MPTKTRDEFIVLTGIVKGFQSVLYTREGDQITKRCVNCEGETVTHKGKRFCNACDEFVTTYKSIDAKAGDVAKLIFISKINPIGTKNYTPSGGFFANAKSRAVGEAIKVQHRLLNVLKVGSQSLAAGADVRTLVDRGEIKAVPRCIKVDNVLEWTAEGVTWTIVA